ncbi:hypothetical protein ASG64_19250 [Rhodococcus sp. Leaf247]|nr:hypothetical protein ASG64_19250 [Rhodococcus sp. Leaf247]
MMLYNLVNALSKHGSGCAYIAPLGCALLLLLTVFFCASALNPRINPADSVADPETLKVPSHLYFGVISTHWKREQYVREFNELMVNPDALVREIASQVHVNAQIASDKMAATKRAIWMLTSAVGALAVTALVVLIQG